MQGRRLFTGGCSNNFCCWALPQPGWVGVYKRLEGKCASPPVTPVLADETNRDRQTADRQLRPQVRKERVEYCRPVLDHAPPSREIYCLLQHYHLPLLLSLLSSQHLSLPLSFRFLARSVHTHWKYLAHQSTVISFMQFPVSP